MSRFWSLLLALIPVASVVGALASASQPGAAGSAVCGVERWPVKTLSDPDAGAVNFKPKRTTVGALRSKPAPTIGCSTPRIHGVETTTYKVRAKLIEYALEDDGDIHLVISAPSNRAKTMIVEFPATTCPGARESRKKGAMRRARAALVAACGAPSTSFHDLRGKATITGVGFFDVKHGQSGVAPNAIELHPVLGFAKATCSRSKADRLRLASERPLAGAAWFSGSARRADPRGPRDRLRSRRRPRPRSRAGRARRRPLGASRADRTRLATRRRSPPGPARHRP